MSSILKAHLSLFFVNLLYGASHVIAKGIMPVFLSPNVFILFRALGATLLFWIIQSFFIKEKVKKKDLGLIALCGVFGVTINQLCFFHGLNLSSSINSGIIMTLNPIIVVVLSFILLKEKISLMVIIGIFLGTIGALLLTLSSNNIGGSSWGDLLLLINATSYAVYLVIAKPLMKKYKPMTVITYVFTFGTLFIILFPPTIPELLATQFNAIPLSIIFKIIYVIIGVTFFTYLLTMYGLKYLSPTVSSSYIYLQPVLVIFFAYFFSYIGWAPDYTSTITIEKIIYMSFIFLGIFIITYPFSKKVGKKL